MRGVHYRQAVSVLAVVGAARGWYDVESVDCGVELVDVPVGLRLDEVLYRVVVCDVASSIGGGGEVSVFCFECVVFIAAFSGDVKMSAAFVKYRMITFSATDVNWFGGGCFAL